MKILLYFEGEKALAKSGIGRALEHQKKALSLLNIPFTMDPKCRDYDILHINTYGVKSFLMVKKAKRAHKKIIYHAHSTEEDFRNSFTGSNLIAPLVKKWLVYLYSQADHIITPTPYSKNLLDGYGIKVPITPLSNGIDLQEYKRNELKEEKFRKYFKIKSSEKVIICVGLFFRRKGILDFVEVAEKLPEYRFIWFGHVPLASIPGDIRKVVTGDHPSNVEFPGYIKGDIIEGAYSASDLFFFPSYEETEGIVILEALASEQNVLVRDIPVYEPWLMDGVNCYKGQNNQDFLATTSKIISGELPSTKEAGLKTAQERDLKMIAKQLELIYKATLAIS